MIEERPYLWATHVWNLFDFAADGRDEGGKHGENQKGLVTMDRRIKKDAFYVYKAYWSREPFVHLCGSRYTCLLYTSMSVPPSRCPDAPRREAASHPERLSCCVR